MPRRDDATPPRVGERPRPELWADDELLTFPEAAKLFWPRGPITVATLRTARTEGKLEVTTIAGKFFVSPRALRAIGRPTSPVAATNSDGLRPAGKPPGRPPPGADGAFPESLDELIDVLGRAQARLMALRKADRTARRP
jgi:hypothetical protein